MNEETRSPRMRRSHRVQVQIPLDFLLLGNALAGVTAFTTETLDMGEGGAKIRVPEELPLGQRLGLSVHLPDGSRHHCRARVLRSSPTPERVGDEGAWAAVEFVEPAPEMRTAIVDLIAATADGERT